MEKEKGGLNDQNKAHHEGTQNNTVKTDNNSISHREMGRQDDLREGTERDTANQGKEERSGNSGI